MCSTSIECFHSLLLRYPLADSEPSFFFPHNSNINLLRLHSPHFPQDYCGNNYKGKDCYPDKNL